MVLILIYDFISKVQHLTRILIFRNLFKKKINLLKGNCVSLGELVLVAVMPCNALLISKQNIFDS